MANTPRVRALGQKLRQRREGIGLSLEEVGHAVGWSKATLSRVERGERDISEADTSALLVPLQVVGEEREHLLKLAREANEPVWWEGHRGLPTVLMAVIDAEQRARRLTDVSGMLIPGLLQTRAYARALFETALEPHLIGEAVAVRLTRQDVLERPDPVEYTAYIDEVGLLRPVGGVEAMAEQLHNLVRVARRPNVTLRVIPLHIGVHRGMDGHFMLIELADGTFNAHSEAANAGSMLDKPHDVAPFRDTVKQLDDLALDAEESVSLILEHAKKMERGDAATVGELA